MQKIKGVRIQTLQVEETIDINFLRRLAARGHTIYALATHHNGSAKGSELTALAIFDNQGIPIHIPVNKQILESFMPGAAPVKIAKKLDPSINQRNQPELKPEPVVTNPYRQYGMSDYEWNNRYR